MSKVAYIAGPYSNGNLADEATRQANVAKARDMAVLYWKLGYAVICPHLNTHDFDLNDGIRYEQILAGDLEIIRRLDLNTDIMVMLRGWERSKGAEREHREALKMELEIKYEDEGERLCAG